MFPSKLIFHNKLVNFPNVDIFSAVQMMQDAKLLRWHHSNIYCRKEKRIKKKMVILRSKVYKIGI